MSSQRVSPISCTQLHDDPLPTMTAVMPSRTTFLVRQDVHHRTIRRDAASNRSAVERPAVDCAATSSRTRCMPMRDV
jgi:hypothetical protein